MDLRVSRGRNLDNFINGLSFDVATSFYARYRDKVLSTPYLRQSEYFGCKDLDGDLVYVNINDIDSYQGYPVDVEFQGNFTEFFSEDCGKIYLFARPTNLCSLEGESVRYIYKSDSLNDSEFSSGITLRCNDNKIFGEIHIWQSERKPFKISKVCDFIYCNGEIEVNMLYESIAGFYRIVSLLYKKHNKLARSDISGSMFEYYNVGNEIVHVFENPNIYTSFVSEALNLFLQNHLCVINGLCEYDEHDNGDLYIGDTYYLSTETKKSQIVDKYSGNYLEVNSDWFRPDMEYLKLVSKIAQLGSEIVVPRDEILSYSEYKEFYFNKEEDVYFIKDEHSSDFEFLEKFSAKAGIISMNEHKLESLYFSYVWNNLHFRLPEIWNKIRLLNKSEEGFIFEYSEIYNTLSVEQIMTVGENTERIFKGDVDLSDLSLEVGVSSLILKSFRPEFAKNKLTNCVELWFDLMSEKILTLRANDRVVTSEDLEELSKSDTLRNTVFECLRNRGYSEQELTSLLYVKDKKVLRNTALASEYEDYCSSLINYILVCILIAEKDKIKIALEELENEIDTEQESYESQEVNKELKSMDTKEEILDIKAKGNSTIYLFNKVKVTKLNKVLGYHLKRRKTMFRYTTPYWVRRGHYTTTRSGERIWVPEQICKRSPELLSLRVGEEEDNISKIYKVTDFFK